MMGTNYYFIAKNKDFVRKYFDNEYEFCDEPDFHYEIHLNKLSCGWKPLFQIHKAFRTFAELEQFYDEHKKDIKIEDEYGDKYTWKQYKKEILDHASVIPTPVKWVYEEDTLCGKPGQKYLMTKECEPEEAELWTPFDHIKYGQTQKAAAEYLELYNLYIGDWYLKYSRDPDYNIDWTEGEFC